MRTSFALVRLLAAPAVLAVVASPASAQWSYDVLHSFSTSEGVGPQASLILASDGHVYGATCGQGDPGGRGTIFRLEDDGTVTVLHTFQPSEGGGCPEELLQASDGYLYGATNVGSPGAPAAAFKMDLAGNFTLLFQFNPSTECAEPTGRLVEGIDGFFYGTCSRALFNDGIAYRIDSAGNLTILHHFDRAVEAVFPLGGLVQTADGSFFGTLAEGGEGSRGGVFRMTDAGDVTMIHAFSGSDGATPFAMLLIANDGRLYGTTFRGGTSDHGTIFSVDPGGADFQSLHAFNGTDGSDPFAGLIELSDGLFGTTNDTLPSRGTVFQLNSSGTLVTLHVFGAAGDGRNPHGGLLALDDHTLLGMTALGGEHSQGTIFRLTRY
jgi:uncharacterized repeat protein (TIGR03803 family)